MCWLRGYAYISVVQQADDKSECVFEWRDKCFVSKSRHHVKAIHARFLVCAVLHAAEYDWQFARMRAFCVHLVLAVLNYTTYVVRNTSSLLYFIFLFI